MAIEKRITLGLGPAAAGDLEWVQQELGLNTTDTVSRAIRLLALVSRRQGEGDAPAFIRPDGSVQEVFLL